MTGKGTVPAPRGAGAALDAPGTGAARRRRGARRAMALLVTVLVLAAVRAALTPGAVPQRLGPGQCLAQQPTGLGVRQHLDAVACTSPHHAEVYGVFDLPAGAYPGVGPVSERAAQGCTRQQPPLGPTLARLHVYAGVPTADTWGDSRQVACMLASADPLTVRLLP